MDDLDQLIDLTQLIWTLSRHKPITRNELYGNKLQDDFINKKCEVN